MAGWFGRDLPKALPRRVAQVQRLLVEMAGTSLAREHRKRLGNSGLE
jgi:hypothetical protein